MDILCYNTHTWNIDEQIKLFQWSIIIWCFVRAIGGRFFLIDGVEARFKELVRQICFQNGYDIIALECDKDHCYLFVNVPPTVSPHMVAKAVKGATSHQLRKEFPQLAKMPSLWTRSYFAFTAGNVSSETIEWYIKTQKAR